MFIKIFDIIFANLRRYVKLSLIIIVIIDFFIKMEEERYFFHNKTSSPNKKRSPGPVIFYLEPITTTIGFDKPRTYRLEFRNPKLESVRATLAFLVFFVFFLLFTRIYKA